MSQRSEALAARFEKALGELMEAVEGCSESTWRALCGEEQWTVAATAHHVGFQWGIEKEYIAAAAGGGPALAYTWDDINAKNARHAQEFAAVSKEDVLKVLREGTPAMAAYVRGLTDEQLDATAPLGLADGAQVSAQQLIEGGVLIAHAEGHLASIRAAG